MTPDEIVFGILRAHPAGCTYDEIVRWTDFDRRTVEGAIQSLRLSGSPILSGSYGVRLARSADELAACVAALRRRAIHQMLTARALRRTAARMRAAEERVEQPSLWS